MVVAIKGIESEKVVDGRRRKTVPFVGTDREGEFAQMGVGLIFPDEQKGTIWGLVSPHALIQSWRGMKILEQVEIINNGTLCACWYAGGQKVHESDKHYLDDLAERLGGTEKLQMLRGEILSSMPNTDELNSMITNLREEGVDVDSWELEEEIKAGRISTSPLIETLVREDEERRQAYRREDEEVKKPLPREESLTAFFEDLGIDNFIVGGGIGGYGIDWGHIKREELDSIAKRDSFSKYLENGHRLEHTTERPVTTGAHLSPGVTMYNTACGEIEQPWFAAVDGTRYTFLYAKFRDDHFFLKTKVEKEGTKPTDNDYTLQQLRDMIGELPQPQKPQKSFLGRLTSIFR